MVSVYGLGRIDLERGASVLKRSSNFFLSKHLWTTAVVGWLSGGRGSGVGQIIYSILQHHLREQEADVFMSQP